MAVTTVKVAVTAACTTAPQDSGSDNSESGSDGSMTTPPQDSGSDNRRTATNERTAMRQRLEAQYALLTWPVRCCFTNETTHVQNSHLVPMNPPKWFRDSGQDWNTYVKKTLPNHFP